MALDLHRFNEFSNFKYDENLAYGVYRQRVISVYPKGDFVKVTIPFSKQLSQQIGQKMSEKFRGIKQENRILQHATTTNVYVELVFYQSADINEEFLLVLNKCLDVLDESEIVTCEVCPLCLQLLHTNDPFIRIRDSVLQAHDHCIEQFINSSKQIEQNLVNNNGKSSTIKPLLISFLCMVLFVLLTCLMSFANAYGYFVFLSGIGFVILNRVLLRKFKLLPNKKQAIIMSVFAVLSVVLSVYLGSSFSLFKTGALNMQVLEIMKNYFNIFMNNYESFGKPILLDILLTLLGAGITISSYFKMISSSKPKIYKL